MKDDKALQKNKMGCCIASIAEEKEVDSYYIHRNTLNHLFNLLQ